MTVHRSSRRARSASIVAALLPLCCACSKSPLPVSGAGSAQPAEHSTAATGEVSLSSEVIQKLGVQTSPAEQRAMTREHFAAGVIGYDESSLRAINTPVAGWVENTSVSSAGEAVRAGQVVMEVYSPTLATVDTQYLEAVAGGANPTDNPYQRGLRSLGLTDAVIAELRDKRRAPGHLRWVADARGVVTALQARRGAYVEPGASLAQWAATDRVWASIALPESMAGAVESGTQVAFTVPAYPGRRFEGRVELLYSEVDPATRRLRARVVTANPDGALKAGMTLTASLRDESKSPSIVVPQTAVIRGEQGDRVIVALGGGRFAPRPVVVGQEGSDGIAILQGLQPGEAVVTRGVFLIDSESSVAAGLSRLDAHHHHGSAAAPEAPHGETH